MGKRYNILQSVAIDLQAAVVGATTEMPEIAEYPTGIYTFQTDIGLKVLIGEKIVDSGGATFPCCSVYALQGLAGVGGRDSLSPDEIIYVAVEAAAKEVSGNREFLADQLLEDIKAAVKPDSISTPHGDILLPKNSGIRWEIDPVVIGSEIVLVRRWYQAEFVETFPSE